MQPRRRVRLEQEIIMNINEALHTRRSIRAFTNQPVSDELLRRLLNEARRAPSGGNLQPCKLHILEGSAQYRLINTIREKISANPDLAVKGEGSEHPVYPAEMVEPYKSRNFNVGAQLYEAIGIARADRSVRLRQFLRNFEFFGAPVGIIVTADRAMNAPQFLDIGLFLQSFALMAVANGLGTCLQGAWSNWHETVRESIGISESEIIFCGISLGYPDMEHPINQFTTARAEIDEFVRFYKN